MPKGGARSRSGPAPDPNALRRERDGAEWRYLPVEGRPGKPPVWPLPSQPRAAELDLWKALWRLPQAVAWEATHREIEVALHVRAVYRAQLPWARSGDGTLVVRQQSELGLTEDGMRRNRWRLGAAPPKRQERQATGTEGRRSARDRFQLIDGGDS